MKPIGRGKKRENYPKRLGISSRRALALFYESNTYQYLRQKIGDLHCMSDNYLIDELIIEYTGKQGS